MIRRVKNTFVKNILMSAAVLAAFASIALAGGGPTSCPSGGTPAPGSRVKGGLIVDGVCVLDAVTVNGGVMVRKNGHLQTEKTTINGGLVVEEGGEADVNAETLGSGLPTHTTSTVNGGVTASNAWDMDIWTAKLDGGIALAGSLNFPLICGNDSKGASSFSDMTGQIGGGNVVVRPGLTCGGNLFDGTVTLTNVTVWMGGNTITGDLLCTNAVVHVTSPNTVTGKNTCY